MKVVTGLLAAVIFFASFPFSVDAYSVPASSIVISRAEWGADESFLFRSTTPPPSSGNGSSSGTPSSRLTECENMQINYPEEFETLGGPVTHDASGRAYRWPLTYSRDVKLLVVHHTALKITGDPRSGRERVQALYKYHAESRGWGDIGYHYVIDEQGKIYEGRQGGKGVIGGHAYCNNQNTVGVAMLGHFDFEAPTQAQTKALQKLLITLGDEYDLDLHAPTTFHGKTFTSPIVGHDDLLSTGCPGYYVDESFGQIVQNVKNRNANGTVSYSVATTPVAPTPSTVSSNGKAPGLEYTGRTTLSMNPGGQLRMSFVYTAPQGGAYEGKKVADVLLGHPDLSLEIVEGSYRIPIRTGILLPSDVPDGESISIQLVLKAPLTSGTYWMKIGDKKFTIPVAGRRIRSNVDISSRFGNDVSRFVNTDQVKVVRAVRGRVRPHTRRSMGGGVTTARVPSRTSIQITPALSSTQSTAERPIRIRLSSTSSPSLIFTSIGNMDGTSLTSGSRILLKKNGNTVQAIRGGVILKEDSILRFTTDSGNTISIDSVRDKVRSYRGVIEARIVDGEITVINELPLETYMRTVAEQPDSEPREKQKAFAIAARTYAVWYMDPKNRKFPGKPYDGSDNPAEFQLSIGTEYEQYNPNWLSVVRETNKQVLKYQGEIIKPPYFSSDDGRTRSPEEIGWKNFPYSFIFSSKADPWCSGMPNRGHGVGMSGCGAEAQANLGKSAEEILKYYYPEAVLTTR